MGKLGVREKSLIHQVVKQPTPSPSPPFHLGFIPAFLQDFDDPADGVPGGVGNFGSGGSPVTQITNNLYSFPAIEADDADLSIPGGNKNFAQISPASGGDLSAGTLWLYTANTGATSGYPGNGFLIWNNATQTSSTALLLAHVTRDHLDLDKLLGYVAPGQRIVIQDAVNSVNFQEFMVTAAAFDTNTGTPTSYWTLPASFDSSGGTGTTGFASNTTLIVFVIAPDPVTLQKTWHGTASGTNTYTVTLTPTLYAYVTGQVYYVTFTNGNSGASTLAANGLGADAIQFKGAALTGSEIASGATVALERTATNFQIVDRGASSSGGVTSITAGQGLTGGTITTTGTLTVDARFLWVFG